MKQLTKRDLLLLAGAAVFNFTVYWGARLLAGEYPHYNFTLPIDRRIPFVPWTILIYWGCYIFWILNYCLSAAGTRGSRFLAAHFLGECVCFLFFILMPTTMERPQIVETTIFDTLIKMTYSVDQADNLLPSIHCFVSWLCFIGVRDDREIPKWYRIASLLMAVAVCISTLTVKQHVIIDVVAGILLAEASYLAAGKLLLFFRNGKNRIASWQKSDKI